MLPRGPRGDSYAGAERAGRSDRSCRSLQPASAPELDPILMGVPLQLLAYRVAAPRGCDIDQPRNLAKSVTVE